MDERKARRRTIAIALAFVSAAGLLVACIGDRWLLTPEGDRLVIALHGATVCKGECASVSSSELLDQLDQQIAQLKKDPNPAVQRAIPRPPWHGFPVVGFMALALSVIAAAGLLWAAVIALQRKRPELAIMPTTIAVISLALAIITGCIFVATKPGLYEDSLTVGWTFWVFGVGVVSGLASVFPLNRQIRPIDVELGEASATMSWGGSRDDVP